MKIKFLGTSAGWPLPRLNCSCGLCSSQDPKDKRTRTQILVDDAILLDAGPDSYLHLKNQNLNKLKAILISHEHPDHIMGFWDITHIYNKNTPIEILVPQAILNGIRKYISVHGKNLKITIVKPNVPFAIGNFKIEYFPVIHGHTPAFGIKVKGNKIFAYAPDFRKILPSQQKVIRGADYIAIDGSTLNKVGQGPGHISIEDGIVIAKRLKAKNTYFVHIGHKTGTHQFLEDYLAKNAGPSFHIAFDGLEIDV